MISTSSKRLTLRLLQLDVRHVQLIPNPGISRGRLLLISRPPLISQRILVAAASIAFLVLLEPWQFTSEEEFSGVGHLGAALIGAALAAGILLSGMPPARRSSAAAAAPETGDARRDAARAGGS